MKILNLINVISDFRLEDTRLRAKDSEEELWKDEEEDWEEEEW